MLKCYINGNEYQLVQGITFNEEYNETLDSAVIMIDQVAKINDLNPYDDVFIYDDKNTQFKGYSNVDYEIKSFECVNLPLQKKILINFEQCKSALKDKIILEQRNIIEGIGITLIPLFAVNFYYTNEDKLAIIIPDLLFSVELTKSGDYFEFDYSSIYDTAFFNSISIKVSSSSVQKPSFYRHFLIDDFTEEKLNPVENIYKYKIQLFSETKKLETIQLPNVSITQPLDINLKKTVWDYMNMYLEMFNPVFKMAISPNEWKYQPKYSLDANLEEIFDNVYCPDFSLDNPNLRDVLSQLFLTKDMIPVVKDDVIYGMDITERKEAFNTNNVISIQSSKSSENYANNLKRTYSNAISENKTARRIEYLGFRNSENALMTIENMRVETQFPIYKINKFFMCYYKKAYIYDVTDPVNPVFKKTVFFLCKQDITQLVKLEQERQILSQDWNNFENTRPTTIEELAQYKLCTVGYSIGGKTIEGWGTKYQYPKGWWDITKSYIENIFGIVDKNIPYGIYTYGYLAQMLGENEEIFASTSADPLDDLVTEFTNTLRLKSFFFEVDYEAFYNGTVITSKDSNRDEITMNDNSSSALTLLEKDGLFQKEKINRFGNAGYVINAIYDNLNELQELGSVYDDDIIIYHREYSVEKNFVKAIYYGTKDYVLKNYYTSVYSKHRPYALMDYGQAVLRSENKKRFIMLSKDVLYYENASQPWQDLPFFYNDFSNGTYLDDIISFAKPSLEAMTIDKFNFPDKLNFGYIQYDDKQYACDINIFTNGYSFCMNIQMNDNISAGNYIKDAIPDINTTILQPTDDDYTGSVQDFYGIIDNFSTGFTQYMAFYFSHIEEDLFYDNIYDYDQSIINSMYVKLWNLPQIPSTEATNVIGGNFKINKDNKEQIDMTYQIEVFSNNNDVIVSEWAMKLSDLNGIYHKVHQTYTVYEPSDFSIKIECYSATYINTLNNTLAVQVLKMPIVDFERLTVGAKVNFIYTGYSISTWAFNTSGWFNWEPIDYDLYFKDIAEITEDRIGFNVRINITYKKGLFGGEEPDVYDTVLYYYKRTSLGDIDFSNDTSNVYFSNCDATTDLVVYYYVEGNNFKSGRFSNGYRIYGNETDLLGFDKKDILISSATGTPKTYFKNLFVVGSSEYLKKTLVYNEYAETQIEMGTGLNPSDVFEYKDEIINDISSKESISFIRINLADINVENLKSVQLWFADRKDNSVKNGTLHFVFGVNISSKDLQQGYVDVYLSSITKKDNRVYGPNHLVVGEITNYLENEQEYGIRQFYVIK